jgi:acetoin utilization deacetylase AcuC-like enzyme
MSALPTALVSHPSCARHDTGWNHPEHQGRLPAVVRGIYGETPALIGRWIQEEAPLADRADILRVHTPDHVEGIREAAARAEALGQPVGLTPDTVVSGASWEAALAAAGAAIHATDLVVRGEAGTAFALTRPPGHHATAGRAMGFCLFNNVAVAARWAQERLGIERVLIVDWDVHHGNGTQDIFYADPSVYYLSLHLSRHYPGTGHPDERGVDAGQGTTRNISFSRGVDRERYLEVYRTSVTEVVSAFQPEVILVSAGFDCLAGDPLGGLMLEPADLHAMTRTLLELAAAPAHGRVVAMLEGGYVPTRTAEGVVQVIRAFADLPGPPDD